jgi:hypothetical protein
MCRDHPQKDTQPPMMHANESRGRFATIAEPLPMHNACSTAIHADHGGVPVHHVRPIQAAGR